MTPGNCVRKLVSNLPSYIRNWLEWLVILGQSPPPAGFPGLGPAEPRYQKEEADRRRRPTRYVMSSLFLDRSYRYLTRTRPEDLHLATGVVLNGAFILNEIIQLPNVQRALTGASASPVETSKGLLSIEAYGLTLGGLFHSHPGQGPDSTFPSSIDLRNHQTWEKAYPLVGAVFSQDGYIRFFTSSVQPQVDVVGKKVSKIDENLYKLKI